MDKILELIKQIHIKKKIISIALRIKSFDSYIETIRASNDQNRSIYIRTIEFEKTYSINILKELSKMNQLQKESMVDKIIQEMKIYDAYYRFFEINQHNQDIIENLNKKLEILANKLSNPNEFQKLRDDLDDAYQQVRKASSDRLIFEQKHFNKFYAISQDIVDKTKYLRSPDQQLVITTQSMITYLTGEKDKLLDKFYRDPEYN